MLDFSAQEVINLKSQIVTSSWGGEMISILNIQKKSVDI